MSNRLVRTPFIFAMLVALAACASPDDSNFGELDFDSGTNNGGKGGGNVTDAKTDKTGDATLCDLTKCPAPPGGAAKCCAGLNVCGYIAQSVCYPFKADGGTGGAGGKGP